MQLPLCIHTPNLRIQKMIILERILKSKNEKTSTTIFDFFFKY